MNWSIDSWVKFNQNFDECVKRGDNKIVFDENATYKTMYLPYAEFYPNDISNSKEPLPKRIPQQEKQIMNPISLLPKIPISPSKKITSKKTSKRTNKKKATDPKKKKKATASNDKGKKIDGWRLDYLRNLFMFETNPCKLRLEQIAVEVKMDYERTRNWFTNYRFKIKNQK